MQSYQRQRLRWLCANRSPISVAKRSQNVDLTYGRRGDRQIDISRAVTYDNDGTALFGGQQGQSGARWRATALDRDVGHSTQFGLNFFNKFIFFCVFSDENGMMSAY